MKIETANICTTNQNVDVGKLYHYVEIPVKGENYEAEVEIVNIECGNPASAVTLKIINSACAYLPKNFIFTLLTDLRTTNRDDVGGTWRLLDKT